MTENAKALKLYAETSDAPLYQALHVRINDLMGHMNRVARDLAKSRSDWMDDPEDERYSAWHGSAAEQFTDTDRLQVLRALLNHQIDELLIQEEAKTLTNAE